MLSGRSALLSGVLRQAFMPKEEYEALDEEQKAWLRLQKPLVMAVVTLIWIVFIVHALIAIKVVYSPSGERPFCHKIPIQTLPGFAFRYTEDEAVKYIWFVIFLPTGIFFAVSLVFLLAGIAVAYTAPRRHDCLMIVENGCCASKRGGVRFLSILNGCFAVAFGLFALLLGSVILNLQSECSAILFRCYQVISWSLAILFGGSVVFLRRKAALILDEGQQFGNPIIGVELLEASADLPQAEVERRINQGFKLWMGSSLSSTDEENGNFTTGLDDVFDDDDDDDYFAVPPSPPPLSKG